MRQETAQLTNDNEELSTQLETAQSRLIELGTELGQLRDDVSSLSDELQRKEQTNGQHTQHQWRLGNRGKWKIFVQIHNIFARKFTFKDVGAKLKI